jgi:hypothetical protein
MGTPMANGTVGRRSLPAATIALVRELVFGEHLSDRVAARRAEISRASVQRIRRGLHCAKGPSTSRVATGEQRLDFPVRCPNGHRVWILPCRACRALDLVQLVAASDARLRAAGR